MRLGLATVWMVGLWSLLVVDPAHAQSTVHPLTLRLETTSDWARLEVSGLRLRVLRKTVSVAGTATFALDGLQIKKAPYDTTPVTLEAQVLAVATGEPLLLRLTRGDIGKTRLVVRAGGRTLIDDTGQGRTPLQGHPRLFSPPLDQLLAAPPPPRQDFGKKVLAFYYAWWGTPQGPTGAWKHWDPSHPHHASTHTPELDWYDSKDPAVIRQHVAWARQAGLDGLVVSLWRGDPTEPQILDALMTEAEQAGLQISAYLEAAETAEDLRAQLQTLLQGPMRRPAWLKAAGRPVVFLYTRILGKLGAAGLRKALHELPVFAIGDDLRPEVLELLDGVHAYMSASVPARYRHDLAEARAAARLWDKLACATVLPGYDDTRIRTPGGVDRREDGRFYAQMWAAAALADWVLVTSFNEFHEGSEIEPTREHGRSYLERTRRHVEAWKR